MFEREIQKAKEYLSKLLQSELPFVYWFEIQEHKSLHWFYKRFFGAEVQWWVFEQQMLRAASPRFDYTHEQLSYHLRNADHYYVECARFDHQDLTTTIDVAVKTRFNYALRPRTTLRWFIYRGEPTKPLQEVLLRLEYFSEYQYLLDGFQRWVRENKKLESAQNGHHEARQEIISVVEFDRVLQSVDNEEILDFSPAQFIELLQPIFELFHEVYGANKDIPSDAVPTAALIIFLDDKGIHPIAQELERLLKDEHKRFMNRDDFLSVLGDIIGKLEPELDGSDTYADGYADIATLPLKFDAGTQFDISSVDSSFEPLPGGSSLQNVLAELSDSVPSANTAEESFNAESAVESASLRAIDEVIGAELKEQLVHSVFHHSEREYQSVIEHLEHIKTWREASLAIDRLLEPLEIDPHTGLARQFREAVYRRYTDG